MSKPSVPEYICDICEDTGVTRKVFTLKSGDKELLIPCPCDVYLCSTCKDTGHVTPQDGTKIAVPCKECRLGSEYEEKEYEDMMNA